MSQHARSDTQLAEQVLMIYQANRRVYGSPRVHTELQAQGIKCARKREATHQHVWHQIASIVISRPPIDWEKWTWGITAIWTYEEWLYLAVVLDLFSRRVVGWAMSAS